MMMMMRWIAWYKAIFVLGALLAVTNSSIVLGNEQNEELLINDIDTSVSEQSENRVSPENLYYLYNRSNTTRIEILCILYSLYYFTHSQHRPTIII